MRPLERATNAVIAAMQVQVGYGGKSMNVQRPDNEPARFEYVGEFEPELVARAVLEAIRDISLDTQDDVEIDMLIKGRAVLPEHDEPLQEDALNCWQAMIDAALGVE